MRAELDTTNLAWQKDAAQFFLYRHMAPAAAEKIVNRIIRLAEAQAPTPTDTSVVRAYRNLAYMYSYRGNNALPQVRSTINKVIDMETKAGHQPSEGYGLDYYVLAETYLPEGNFKVMGDCIEKCINILEKVPNVFKAQMGEAYMLKGISLIRTNRIHEGIEVLLNQAVPNFLAEDSPVKEKVPLMVYPLVFNAYGDLIEKNPKDKNLLKEYQQFMADKLLVAVFNSTDKKRNLFGEYYVVENGSWNVENPVPSFDNLRFVLQKGDEHMEVVKDSEDEQVGIMRIDIVDAAKKQEVINKWKAYKKDKKVKK
jgi:tetratricopeptide (TPR) repeat protein